jgi:hypothetical protein
MAIEGLSAFRRTACRILVAEPRDAEARAEALYGAWLCGTVLGTVGMALHHKICHTLGGTFDTPHADTHAIMLPHTAAFNAVAAQATTARPGGKHVRRLDRRRALGFRQVRRRAAGAEGSRPFRSRSRPRRRDRHAKPLPEPARRSIRPSIRALSAGGLGGRQARLPIRHLTSGALFGRRDGFGRRTMLTRRELPEDHGGRRRRRPATSGFPMPAIAQSCGGQARLCQPADRAARRLRRGRQASSSTASWRRRSQDGLNYEIVVKDSQSNPNRAAEVAKELIVDDEVNLMLVSSTPETTNPVATTCEAEQACPALSTVAPWQPWFIGQQGNPGDPAELEAVRLCLPLLLGAGGRHRRLHRHVGAGRDQQKGRRPVPERRRRQCLGRQGRRLPARAGKNGLLADRPRPLPESDGRFLRADQRLQGRPVRDHHRRRLSRPISPPSGTRPSSRVSKPKVASIGKALLFPQAVEALGNAGHNLSYRGLVVAERIRSSRR